jgi:glutathione S-transferase
MKLYYSTGSCSLAPDIALHEAGVKFDREKVDLKQKVTETGANYRDVNPKGSVPALELDDGQVLTEVAAVVQYIADQVPAKKLAPPAGSLERYRLQEWLSFVGTELHKSFSAFFRQAPDAWQDTMRQALAARFDFLTQKLQGKQYLMGDDFTVADAYCFAVIRWTELEMTKIDLSKWPVLVEYKNRIAARPAVHAAMVAQGIIKA